MDLPCLEGALVNVKRLWVLPPIAVAGVLLFGGCVGGAEDPVFAQGIDPITTPTPTPPAGPGEQQATPEPTPTPTPTPIPPLVSRSDAEGAVLDAIADCTDAVALTGAGGAPGAVRLFFESEFSPVTRSWLIKVDTADFAVTFGTWRVNEGGLLLARAVDRIADRIANSGLVCEYPSVLLEADPAPPRFVAPPPLAEGELGEEEPEGPAMLIATSAHAAMRVWTGVYDCSQDFPDVASFIGREYVNGSWVVEGKSELTAYGLWEVDAYTGDVFPLDGLANAVVASCDATPIVLTGSQAAIRVWVASYDCYGAVPPRLEAFVAAQESPHRWVVEGRETTIDPLTGVILGQTLLGLWLVETDSGAITGLDASARSMRAQACFQTFE